MTHRKREVGVFIGYSRKFVTRREGVYQLPRNRLLKKDAAPPPTLRWWGGDCQATPYVRQSGPPPTPRRWRRDWRLSAGGFKPLLAWKSGLHRPGAGGGRARNNAVIAGQASLPHGRV